ncbi:uridine kinase family protein [Modestobacter altitudinis]|uniref:uridine kinase family protein n=1 Tax=Modestobacter altitudinis TaxID=2213158 RepID=UPI00110CB425|nr:(d)CMP kinase [Modestobacter altitudinis]
MRAVSGTATPGRGTFAALADQVRAAAPRLGCTRLVCVDGPAGSGKTTFAGRLAAELGAPVLHMDDVYAGWTLTGGFARLAAGVLRPLREGRAGAVHRYDWDAARFAELVQVPVGPALVVEGCGSAPRDVDPYAVLRVWVEAPRAVRMARGIARDGEAMRPEWLRWQQQEAAQFAAQDTRARADLLVDGTAGPGDEEYTLLPGRAALPPPLR